jgi:hypothetical protein
MKMLSVGQKVPQNPNDYGQVRAEKTPGETHEVDITLTSGEKMTVIAPWASFCDYFNDAFDGGSNR